MGDKGEIINVSIFGSKSVEMTITSAWLFSEDQKMI